jgi:hypothetical protein
MSCPVESPLPESRCHRTHGNWRANFYFCLYIQPAIASGLLSIFSNGLVAKETNQKMHLMMALSRQMYRYFQRFLISYFARVNTGVKAA